MKERASPRRDVYFVPRKRSAEPRGTGTLHGFVMVCKRAIGASVNRFLAKIPSAVILSEATPPCCGVETRSANGKTVWISRRQELRRVLASPLEKLRARAIVRGDEERR